VESAAAYAAEDPYTLDALPIAPPAPVRRHDHPPGSRWDLNSSKRAGDYHPRANLTLGYTYPEMYEVRHGDAPSCCGAREMNTALMRLFSSRRCAGRGIVRQIMISGDQAVGARAQYAPF